MTREELAADLMERVERANLLLIAPLGEATDTDVITWWRYILRGCIPDLEVQVGNFPTCFPGYILRGCIPDLEHEEAEVRMAEADDTACWICGEVRSVAKLCGGTGPEGTGQCPKGCW